MASPATPQVIRNKTNVAPSLQSLGKKDIKQKNIDDVSSSVYAFSLEANELMKITIPVNNTGGTFIYSITCEDPHGCLVYYIMQSTPNNISVLVQNQTDIKRPNCIIHWNGCN